MNSIEMASVNRVILLVLDGWGVAPPGEGNYISQAETPNFNRLVREYPNTINQAAGNAVGLPERAQGNSEVGHLHMGAGRIVWQMYEKINRAVKDGRFKKNRVLLDAINYAKKNNSSLHLMGLCSDEGVHAHVDHLLALVEMAADQGLEKVYIHFFGDGRDVAEKSAKKYVDTIESKCKQLGVGRIASVVGRYYSMDRDKNWDRTKKAYDMLTLGEGYKAKTANDAIEEAYKRGDKTDYYIKPTVIVDENNQPLATIKDNDSVIFFNFRTDRPRQLTEAFLSKDFDKFERTVRPSVLFTAMSRYDKTFDCPVAFNEEMVDNNLGKVLADAGLKQLRMAETEKYGHVTYFFNSQIEEPNPGEERVMIPSSKVKSYDLKPEMSAYEIAEEAVKQIASKKYDFMLINFANCDLVGHSAVKEAIIKCVGVVDDCLGKVVEAGLENDYTVVVTADHGSAEDKLYPDGKPKPAHSKNPVPFILVSHKGELGETKLMEGGQQDVAPTILELMGLDKPSEMTGESLMEH